MKATKNKAIAVGEFIMATSRYKKTKWLQNLLGKEYIYKGANKQWYIRTNLIKELSIAEINKLTEKINKMKKSLGEPGDKKFLTPEQSKKLHIAAMEKILRGRRIVGVDYTTAEENDLMAWYESGIVLILDDKTTVVVMADPEGNGPGALNVMKGNKTYLFAGM